MSEILDIERAFTNDKIILKDFFNQQFNLEFIDDIIFGMSEPHDDGKSVCKIVFEPGLNLIYKPRSVNIDCAFYDLLTWIESKNNLPKQYKRKILAKNDYGWCEYIEYQQLNTLREAENYFERCGGLLAIIYFLHGNDFHHENIVAFGEYPVLIDLETIYQPVINLFKNENTNSSIFSSHFLPKKYIIKGVEMDITGLGYNSKTVKPTLTFQWKNLNTDKIKLTLSLYKNYNSQSVPKHLDKEQTVEDYEVNFLRGFDSIYNSLLDNRENLIATNGPLDQLFFCKARFVFRSSDLYRGIFTRVFLAQSLKEERQAFREISLVKRFFKENTDNSHLVLATLEMVSMWFLDYPRFEFNGFSDELKTNLLSCKGFFMMSVANQIKNRILSLDSNDLLIQSDIIKLAFVERRLKND